MGKFQRELDGKRNETKQEFLRSFFTEKGYQEKEVNGFWIVKQGGGNEVCAIYTKENYERYKRYQELTGKMETRIK